MSSYSQELVPFRLFSSVEAASAAVAQYHEECHDGRSKVWKIVVNHWKWLVREGVLADDQVASVFIQALHPTWSGQTDNATNCLWFMIKQLAKNNRTSPKEKQVSPARKTVSPIMMLSSPREKSPIASHERTVKRGTVLSQLVDDFSDVDEEQFKLSEAETDTDFD